LQQITPIALFVYNRAEHTRRTLEALAANGLASRSDLVVFSDGPKGDADVAEIRSIREHVSQLRGFGRVVLKESASNRGLAASIISGTTAVVAEYGRIIVVEDDLVTSPHFLQYMSDGLDRYEGVERVGAISGFMYPNQVDLPETFFMRDADCWGWGTWARGWALFDPDGVRLLAQLKQRKLLRDFDLDGAYPYARMLRDQIAGRNQSWAIRWRASLFVRDMLSLYPRRSLVTNIGLDGTGTHSGTSHIWGSERLDEPLAVRPIPIEPNAEALAALKAFNREHFTAGLPRRLVRKAKRMIGRLTRTATVR
jgi:hypothetical protein